MKKSLLLALLCIYTAQAQAAHVYFDDGRVCKGCKVVQKGDRVLSVTDKKGDAWKVRENQRIWVDKHPYARAYAQRTAFAAQQYGQQMQMQNLMQQRQPVNINCTSTAVGMTGYTNCSGY